MAAVVSRNGKIIIGAVLIFVVSAVAILAIGSAAGWYDGKHESEMEIYPAEKVRRSLFQ